MKRIFPFEKTQTSENKDKDQSTSSIENPKPETSNTQNPGTSAGNNNPTTPLGDEDIPKKRKRKTKNLESQETTNLSPSPDSTKNPISDFQSITAKYLDMPNQIFLNLIRMNHRDLYDIIMSKYDAFLIEHKKESYESKIHNRILKNATGNYKFAKYPYEKNGEFEKLCQDGKVLTLVVGDPNDLKITQPKINDPSSKDYRHISVLCTDGIKRQIYVSKSIKPDHPFLTNFSVEGLFGNDFSYGDTYVKKKMDLIEETQKNIQLEEEKQVDLKCNLPEISSNIFFNLDRVTSQKESPPKESPPKESSPKESSPKEVPPKELQNQIRKQRKRMNKLIPMITKNEFCSRIIYLLNMDSKDISGSYRSEDVSNKNLTTNIGDFTLFLISQITQNTLNKIEKKSYNQIIEEKRMSIISNQRKLPRISKLLSIHPSDVHLREMKKEIKLKIENDHMDMTKIIKEKNEMKKTMLKDVLESKFTREEIVKLKKIAWGERGNI